MKTQQINISTFEHFCTALFDVTSEGRVQDWIERIAELVNEAGMDRTRICWQGSPRNVAFNVWERLKALPHYKEPLAQAIMRRGKS